MGVAVPNGERLRLTCPAGDGSCDFEVADVTLPPSADKPKLSLSVVEGTQKVKCGEKHATNLVNLSEREINVKVEFKSLCMNPSSGATKNPGKIYRETGALVHNKLPPELANDKNPIEVATENDPKDVHLGAGYALFIECPAKVSDKSCQFTVTLEG